MGKQFVQTIWPRQYRFLISQNEYNQIYISNLQKLNNTFCQLQKIYDYQDQHNVSMRKAIDCLKLTFAKNRLYRYHKKIGEFQFDDDINKLLIKPTGPIKIKYVYDQNVRKLIADAFYNLHMCKSNIYISMRRALLPNIAYNTVLKIIKRDARHLELNPRKAKIKHPMRFYNIDFGNLQMDLKIIGPKESPTGQRITIFDAKDEQSKLYFMEVIESQTKENLLNATRNLIDYFHKTLKLPIKRIRTDNAMVFKKNNFVSSFEFDTLLKSHNIKHEKIPLGQPQCNGVIERHHKILDQEFKPLITSDDTIKSIKSKAMLFMKNFNFSRSHYYSFLQKCSDYKTFESRFKIPYYFYKSAFNYAL